MQTCTSAYTYTDIHNTSTYICIHTHTHTHTHTDILTNNDAEFDRQTDQKVLMIVSLLVMLQQASRQGARANLTMAIAFLTSTNKREMRRWKRSTTS